MGCRWACTYITSPEKYLNYFITRFHGRRGAGEPGSPFGSTEGGVRGTLGSQFGSPVCICETHHALQRDALKRRGGVVVERPVDKVRFREGAGSIPGMVVKKNTGVAQRKRAVKPRLLHLDLRGSDLRTVMDHTPEDVGSKPTTGNIHFAGFTEAGRHSQATSKHGTQSNNQYRCGAEAARGAHNSEVTRSKRVSGNIHFAGFAEAGRHSSSDVKTRTTHIHRGGAGVARGAHNSEDIGSRPISGIFPIRQLYRSRHGAINATPPHLQRGGGRSHNIVTAGNCERWVPNRVPPSRVGRVRAVKLDVKRRLSKTIQDNPITSRCSSAEERLTPSPTPSTPTLMYRKSERATVICS